MAVSQSPVPCAPPRDWIKGARWRHPSSCAVYRLRGYGRDRAMARNNYLPKSLSRHAQHRVERPYLPWEQRGQSSAKPLRTSLSARSIPATVLSPRYARIDPVRRARNSPVFSRSRRRERSPTWYRSDMIRCHHPGKADCTPAHRCPQANARAADFESCRLR
jgi:hypothetical protein